MSPEETGAIPPETGQPALRQRPGDQPLPVPNASPDIQSMVISDIRLRREVGIERYGTALQPHNGRDALRDLYEELLDAVMYVRQVMAERDGMAQVTVPRGDLSAVLMSWDRDQVTPTDRLAWERTVIAAGGKITECGPGDPQ